MNCDDDSILTIKFLFSGTSQGNCLVLQALSAPGMKKYIPFVKSDFTCHTSAVLKHDIYAASFSVFLEMYV